MPYFFLVLLLSCAIPPLTLFAWIVLVEFWGDIFRDYRWAVMIPSIFVAALIPILTGLALGKRVRLPESTLQRYLPLVLPVMLGTFASPVTLWLDEENAILSYFSAALSVATLCVSILYVGAFAFGSRKRPGLGGSKAALQLGLAFLLCASVTGWVWYERVANTLYDEPEEATVGHGVNLWLYRPFGGPEYSLLATPGTPPTLRITANYPRLDGAIALAPVYGAVAQAIYGGLDEGTVNDYVLCSNTPEGYKRLADGKVDIFFGLGPSTEQREYIESKGLTPVLRPLAKEAFVFLVHKDNPVQGLTLEQIRDIYTKRITNWKDLGGSDKPILAFQRPAGSGSQTTMLADVMQGRRMSAPLREEISEGMGDLVNHIAEYRNRVDAIGYSFRWYASVQYANPNIRFLAVNGVLPTEENIRNGTYPLTVPFMAVTVRPLSPEAEKLLQWIQGPEGQDLIQRTGYVPGVSPGEK